MSTAQGGAFFVEPVFAGQHSISGWSTHAVSVTMPRKHIVHQPLCEESLLQKAGSSTTVVVRIFKEASSGFEEVRVEGVLTDSVVSALKKNSVAAGLNRRLLLLYHLLQVAIETFFS